MARLERFHCTVWTETFADQWPSTKSIIHENHHCLLSCGVKMVGGTRIAKYPSEHLCFIVSAQQQLSKIHLCRLAIPDNFVVLLPLYQPYATSTRTLHEIHWLRMVNRRIRFPFTGGHFTWFYRIDSMR